MNELVNFYQRNSRFVLSAFFLTFSILLAGYSIIVTTSEAWIQHVSRAERAIKSENTKLTQTIENFQKAQEAEAENAVGVRSLPSFLRRINDLSRSSKVIIDELVPNKSGGLQFRMKFIDTYFKFLLFASQLESLNVSINNIGVHPYDPSATPPLHVVTFDLTPRSDAEPLGGERLGALKERVNTPNKRNPFQRLVNLGDGQKERREIDLTWIYKLSGIGRVGDNLIATIDSRDYQEGDTLQGMTITDIQSDRIELEKDTDNGLQRYRLGFRRVRTITSE
ncbi:MAG: hypothetical protein ACPGOV_15845 [Magnetovibrionaceae bacterium]